MTDSSLKTFSVARLHGLLSLLLLGLLTACAQNPRPLADVTPYPAEHSSPAWEPVKLPGKRATRYAREAVDGRTVWRADADQSASMWRQRLHWPAHQLGHLNFSWKVEQLIDGATLGEADHDDAPARIVVAFDGDHARLSPRNRMLFELADSLTGVRPPYGTLMYVW